MDGTWASQGLCSPCQQGPLLPHKNASAILSGSHSPYIMAPPPLHYNKRINLPRICKVIGPRGGVLLNCPFPLAYITSLFLHQSRATNHQRSSRGSKRRRRWAAAAAHGNQEQIWSHYGGPAVDLHNSMRSIRPTGRDAASLAHFLLLLCNQGSFVVFFLPTVQYLV